MRIELAYISPRRHRLKSAPAQALLDDFIARITRFMPCQSVAYDTEPGLLSSLDRAQRTATSLLLLDSRGRSFTSENFAAQLGSLRDSGLQQLVCAVGPPDGWSSAAWNRADLRLSLGAMTLPHELALVVLAEQTYRALAILAGHPYHNGHM